MTDQVVALFPYTAQNEDELSFLQGDVLIIIDREDPAWWRGELKGQVLYIGIYLPFIFDFDFLSIVLDRSLPFKLRRGHGKFGCFGSFRSCCQFS